jgi:hypothetical protein
LNLRCGELSGLEFAVAADEANPRKIFCLKMCFGLKIKGVPAAGLGSGSSTGSGRDALAPTRHQGTKGAPPGVWWPQFGPRGGDVRAGRLRCLVMGGHPCLRRRWWAAGHPGRDEVDPGR